MNPLSPHILNFIYKYSRDKLSETAVEDAGPELDFEAFVDMLSVFHKSTSTEIKLRCERSLRYH